MPEVELTWLGQAGFVVRLGDVRLAIDPFLSPHPARPYPPPPLETIGPLDWVLVTHAHIDHLDLPSLPALATANPGLRVLLPANNAEALPASLGPSQVVAVRPGELVELSPEVSVDIIPAYHAEEPADGYGDGDGRFVGYRLLHDGASIYHSGDTIVTDALLAALAGKTVDVALLPVNGRDYFRERAGLVGNLDAREAAMFAAELGARILVPMHWDLFQGNTVQPGDAVNAMAQLPEPLHVFVPARERTIRLRL